MNGKSGLVLTGQLGDVMKGVRPHRPQLRAESCGATRH